MQETSPSQPDDYLVVDADRPSTTKTRIIAHNQLVVRADREHERRSTVRPKKRIISSVESKRFEDADAFVVSDYDKGVVTPHILGEILPLAYERLPVLIDPKIRNFSTISPASLITPNHHEALRMTNLEDDSDEGLHQAAGLYAKNSAAMRY